MGLVCLSVKLMGNICIVSSWWACIGQCKAGGLLQYDCDEWLMVLEYTVHSCDIMDHLENFDILWGPTCIPHEAILCIATSYCHPRPTQGIDKHSWQTMEKADCAKYFGVPIGGSAGIKSPQQLKKVILQPKTLSRRRYEYHKVQVFCYSMPLRTVLEYACIIWDPFTQVKHHEVWNDPEKICTL